MDDRHGLAVTPEKLELLKSLLRARGLSTGSEPIAPLSGADTKELSFAQQRLWFLDQFEPQNRTAYNISLAIRLVGALELRALRWSFQEIVRRHGALRTRFVSQDGIPRQDVVDYVRVDMPVIDLQPLGPEDRLRQAQDLAKLEAHASFDIGQVPLLRTTLLRLHDHDYVLLFTVHHIVFDGWSLQVLFRELGELYEAFQSGTQSPLPALPVQYTDYAAWQRRQVDGDFLESQLEYWKGQLGDAPTVLDLPLDRPRPAVRHATSQLRYFELPKELIDQLRLVSQHEGTTLFMTLLAAFGLLLHRYSGQNDLLIGSPTAGRTRLEIESLIGFFVNTLVLRIDVSDDPDTREYLRRVSAVCKDAYGHQDAPFERVVDVLQPERDRSRPPLVQVMFSELTVPDLVLPGIETRNIDIGSGGAQVDLWLTMMFTPSGVVGRLEYNSELFSAETVCRMAGHFKVILNAIATELDTPVTALPLLTTEERIEILDNWNSTEKSWAKNKPVHELFRDQAALTPNSVAAVYGAAELTYLELDERSNQLAHYLQKLGVGPDVPVGVCVERSLDMIVGLLGILKSGGAYVPLDPEYPTDRLSYMIEHSGLRVLVTQEDVAQALPDHGTTSVCLDSDWADIARESIDPPSTRVELDRLAYAIYTSGSTGRPKGVMIQHGSLTNILLSFRDQPGLTENDVLASVTTISFDIAALELYLPLVTGARLVIVPRHVAMDGGLLMDLLNQYGATVMQATPATWRLLLEAGWPGRPEFRIWCGGEALPRALADSLLDLGTEVWNLYGPTETTIWSMISRVANSDGPVPIGRPIANTIVYILDYHMQPVPAGAPGELYIGGAGLARGYLGRADLTTERFVPSPFAQQTGERLYRTGDLVRYRTDGVVEFLGRMDHQVKVRGFRIELGEIEAVLRGLDGIRDAIVVAREHADGDKRLVAYVVAETGPSSSAQTVRGLLKDVLPDYMLPSSIVFLDGFPLTPNGKVDRKALPAPGVLAPHSDHAYVLPRTRIEEQLVQLWEEILGIPRVGIHDDFFALGGDSLLVMQVVTRSKRAGIKLTVSQFFENPTIAELAMVEGLITTVEAEQGMVSGPVPLVPRQNWYLSRAGVNHNRAPVLVCEATEPLAPDLLGKAVEHLLVHHDALRMRFTYEDGEWHQFNAVSEEHDVFASFDLRDLEGVDLSQGIRAARRQLAHSIDLGHGPLIRIGLLRLGDAGPDQLLLLVHHLVADAYSRQILLEDLDSAYQQLKQGKEVRLPAKTTSFKAWAEHLVRYAQSDEIRAEIGYWLDRPWDRVRRFSMDHPADSTALGRVQGTRVELDPETTERLMREFPAVYGTPIADAILASAVQAIISWTQLPFQAISMRGHGRDGAFADVDLLRTVGWCVSSYPLLIAAETTADMAKLLREVRDTVRQVPMHGLGYEVLTELHPDPEVRARMNILREPQITFNYQGQIDQLAAGSSLSLLDEGLLAARTVGRTMPKHAHIAVSAHVRAGRLSITFTYHERAYRPDTIEGLLEVCKNQLLSLLSPSRLSRASE